MVREVWAGDSPKVFTLTARYRGGEAVGKGRRHSRHQKGSYSRRACGLQAHRVPPFRAENQEDAWCVSQ